jgi:hypothetical protein
MKRAHSTKKFGLGALASGRQSAPRGYSRSIIMSVTSIHSSNSATTTSNSTASSLAAPHRKNAAQPNRSDSPYQGRTAQRDNPTQAIIRQAVEHLIEQVEAGKSETLTAYLTAMARFHNYSFLCCD